METLLTRTVGEIAAEVPAAIRIFERLRIDYCCGGATPLTDACERAGTTVDAFVNELNAAALKPETTVDWTQRSLSDLQAYLVGKYHVHAREELETLNMLAGKVFGVHGTRHQELRLVTALVQALEQDMLPHMVKEEMILFPYVEGLENGTTGSSCFGTVQNPIRQMMMEHESVGEILARLRTATDDYTPPADGCFSYRELYRRLAEFEAETHEHIHLENNVHFPRAVKLEQ